MKRLLFLIAFLFSDIALAGGPCIFGGAYVKCFPAGGIKLENGQALLLKDNDDNYVTLRSANDMPADFTIKFPSALGSTGQVLSSNGTDGLDWITVGSTNLNINETFDPGNIGTTRNTVYEHPVPTGDSSAADVNALQLQLDQDSVVSKINSSTLLRLSSNVSAPAGQGVVSLIEGGGTYGNGSDAITVDQVRGINFNAGMNANTTLSGVSMVNVGVNDGGNSSTTVTDYRAYNESSVIANIGSFSGYELQTQLGHAANNLFGFTFGGTITDADQSIFGHSFTPNIVNADGNVLGFNIGGNWGTLHSGTTGFNDSPQVTNHLSSYSSFNSSPNFVDSSQFTGVNIGPNFQNSPAGTFSGWSSHPSFVDMPNQVNIFEDSANITGTLDDNYLGVNIHPNINSVTGNVTGLQFSGNAVGDGTNRATGLSINMGGYTGFDPTQVRALDINGIVSVNAEVPIESSGNPTPVHNFNTGFTTADNSTISSIDRFGFGPIMSIHTGDNSTLTSGGLPLGLASLGMVNLIDVGSGSSLSAATGSFVAMVNIGNGGTLTDLNGYMSVFATGGGTSTVTNGYAFKTLNGGLTPTNSWGLWDSAAQYNWMNGSLQIGGSAGSTDRVANASVGLGVLDKAIYPVPMTTTDRDALTPLEGMLINNSTTGDLERYNGAAWAAVAGGGGSGISIGDAITGSSPGGILFADPSNNLGQDGGSFVWDAVTASLGVGTNTPSAKIDIADFGGGPGLQIREATDGNDHIALLNNANDYTGIRAAPTSDGGWTLVLPPNGGTAGNFLATDGSGVSTWEAPGLVVNVSEFTDGVVGGVVWQAPDDTVSQSSDFVFDGTTLAVGTPTPDVGYRMDVLGNTAAILGIHTDSIKVDGFDNQDAIVAVTNGTGGSPAAGSFTNGGTAGAALRIKTTDDSVASVQLLNASDAGIDIKVSSATSSYGLTLPVNQASDANSSLMNDAGVLRWAPKTLNTCSKVTNNCSGTTCSASCSGSGVVAVAGGCRSTVSIIGSYPDLSDWKCETTTSATIDAYATCCILQ